MKKLVKLIGVVILMAAAFLLGLITAPPRPRSTYGEPVQFIQADRAMQDIETLRELQGYLENGCGPSAKKLLSEKIELNMMLLAEHLKDYPDGVFIKMLEKRDPVLLGKIRSQRINWARTYSIPECIPTDAAGSSREDTALQSEVTHGR